MQTHLKDRFKLKKGDKIGLITPSSPIEKKDINTAVENIIKIGFVPEYLPGIADRQGFFAGSAENRADELHHFFMKEDIKAIMAVRGGYGSFEILGAIDFELIKKQPKPFIGYSDVTTLLSAIYHKCGFPVFHAPMALGGFSNYSEKMLKKLLSKQEQPYIIGMKNQAAEHGTICPGKSKGVLFGGNLSVLVSLLGTAYEPDYRNKILFLEEVNEPPYKVHRMLRQLEASGKLSQVRGIILGTFEGCDNKTAKEKAENFSLSEVLNQIITPLRIPSVYGFPFGHTKKSAALPLGLIAELNADTGDLSVTNTY